MGPDQARYVYELKELQVAYRPAAVSMPSREAANSCPSTKPSPLASVASKQSWSQVPPKMKYWRSWQSLPETSSKSKVQLPSWSQTHPTTRTTASTWASLEKKLSLLRAVRALRMDSF